MVFAVLLRSSEGGMMRLETLIELKLLNSIRVVQACPLVEIRQTAPCRAIRGDSISVSSTLPPLKIGARAFGFAWACVEQRPQTELVCQQFLDT